MVFNKIDDGETPAEKSDGRMEFLRDSILKALRLKSDKWDRMFISDEQRMLIIAFLDTGHPQVCKIQFFLHEQEENEFVP